MRGRPLDLIVLAFLAAYTALAILLLVLGLGAALAVDPRRSWPSPVRHS